jgi:aldehyde:ferredoxin oxidoreductase
MAADLVEKLGINAFEIYSGLDYLKALYDKGVLGLGKEINTDLPLDEIGEAGFIEELLHRIAYRVEIGNDLAEGFARASERWGRLEEDLRTGIHPAMFMGYPVHYDARTETYWGYASIVGGRDINCHDFNVASYWMPTLDIQSERIPILSAAEVAEIIEHKCAPFNDPLMIDFSDKNIYSEHMGKTVAWLVRYSFFWKQSCGLCDNAFADFVNPYGPNNTGLTPEGEVRFFKAVTGKDLNFADSMEIGRRIWNLNRAILVLQGRERDMEVFPEYVYSVDCTGVSYVPGKPPAYYMPMYEDGKWKYGSVVPRHLDRNRVEEWKTGYYGLEGWDPKTGWPTKKILEELGLAKAAEQLARQGKL